jgi:hypothetical protein
MLLWTEGGWLIRALSRCVTQVSPGDKPGRRENAPLDTLQGAIHVYQGNIRYKRATTPAGMAPLVERIFLFFHEEIYSNAFKKEEKTLIRYTSCTPAS